MNEERQGYLDVDGIVVFVYGIAEDGSACEYKFNHYEGNQVENPSKVIVEKDKFGVV